MVEKLILQDESIITILLNGHGIKLTLIFLSLKPYISIALRSHQIIRVWVWVWVWMLVSQEIYNLSKFREEEFVQFLATNGTCISFLQWLRDHHERDLRMLVKSRGHGRSKEILSSEHYRSTLLINPQQLWLSM